MHGARRGRETCAAKIGCYGWDYRDVDDCLASQECDGWNQLQTLLASSAVEYDGAAALACHQRLLADPCALGEILFSVPNLAQTLKRCGALSGQLDVGAPCESSVACKSGLTCDTSSTCPSTCQLPANDDLPAGASCVPELCIPAQEHCSQCGAGLDCVNNVCAPTPKLGDACAGSLGCLSTWWCNPASSRCEKLAVVDEPCSDFRQKAAHCEEGLWCDDPSNGFETGICRALASRGGICRKDQDCNKPLTCLPPGGATPAFYGTCDDKQPNGAPCNSYADCESDLCGTSVCLPQPVAGETCTGKCAEGLICKKNEATGSGSVCAVKRYTGDPCDAASDCQNSRCIAGVCARRAALGSICQVDDDCLSKHCISGACTDPPGCTG